MQPQTNLITIQRNQQNIEIEYQWLNENANNNKTIVFLHEGLGSISMWRDWPEQLCKEINCKGLVYSRYGYGQSTPRFPDDKRDTDYLHYEAIEDMPQIFKKLGIDEEKLILFGHSDGGSIALLYAALSPDKVDAIAVAAPHIYVEDITLDGIRKASKEFETTDLAKRLARHHKEPNSVFFSWNTTWQQPHFAKWNIELEVGTIKCPILAIQGDSDEYGTLDQIYDIEKLNPNATAVTIPECGHWPHKEKPQLLIKTVADFLKDQGTI